MSIKIHHGYRLAEDIDPFTFITAAREVLDPVRDGLDAALLATGAARLIDVADLSGKPRPESPVAQSYADHLSDQDKLGPARRGHDPHRCELAFGRDPFTGRHGVLLYADSPAMTEAFEALSDVEEYGYWNNTDRPDGVSAAQWQDRSDFWGRTLPGHRPPVETTLSWSLRGTNDIGMMWLAQTQDDGDVHPLLIEHLPSKETRARGRAQTAVTSAGPRDREFRTSDFIRFMHTDDYPEVVAAIADALADLDGPTVLGAGHDEQTQTVSALDEATRARIDELAEAAHQRIADRLPVR